MEKEETLNLIREALKARNNSYAPYSHFTVGAALLTEDGRIYRGCNVESAAYGATNCAERTAVFTAICSGDRKFKAIAIAGGREGQAPLEYAYPCGTCRQVLGEFVSQDFTVIIAKSTEDYKEYLFSQLLPYGFGGESLK